MLEQFGKYSLVRRLAFGGMAEIFLAQHSGTQGFSKRLVVKRILPQFGDDPDFVKMFVDEAVIAARLDHPNIVQIYDFGEVNDNYFIAMELVDGADLSCLLRVCRERSITPSYAVVAAIGEDICKGLSYAHNYADEVTGPLNIIHRDISPHNVMVSRAGNSKVMDFGIAKAQERVTKTSTGTVKGKVAYMAPEQLSDRDLDKRADQFSVGLVLRECLTGVRFFRGASQLELVREVMEYKARPVALDVPDVPEALGAIIDKSLARDPDERFPDLLDMAQALSSFRFSLGVAGAVDIGAWVDGLIPKQVPQAPGRSTKVLPDVAEKATAEAPDLADTFSERTTVTADADPEEPRQDSGWGEAKSSTAPTRQATPRGLALTEEARTPGVPSEAGPPVAAHTKSSSSPTPMVWVLGVVLLVTAAVGGWGLASTSSGAAHDETQKVTSVTKQGVLDISSTPSGAQVFVDERDTGLLTPTALPVPVGEHRSIRLVKQGYRAYQQNVQVDQERQPLMIQLVPSRPKTRPVPEPKVIKSPTPQTPTPQKRWGYVNINSTGAWLDVYLGKKKLGITRKKLKLPVGKHRLRLRRSSLGIDGFVQVNIRRNQTTGVVVDPSKF